MCSLGLEKPILSTRALQAGLLIYHTPAYAPYGAVHARIRDVACTYAGILGPSVSLAVCLREKFRLAKTGLLEHATRSLLLMDVLATSLHCARILQAGCRAPPS